MNRLRQTLERPRTLVIASLAALLLLGTAIFADYGLHWDELANRRFAMRSFERATAFFTGSEMGPPSAALGDEHGTAFEGVLYLTELVLGLDFTTESRTIFLLRHYLTFLLFFAAVALFYRLCRAELGSWKLGLLGCLLLVLHPRIFAHAFYNSNDIGFLAASVIAAYAFHELLKKPTPVRAILLGLACAFAIDIRIVGILYPAMACVILFIECLRTPPASRRQRWVVLALVSTSTILFVVLLWPFLWADPIGRFAWALGEMSRIAWTGKMLYMGDIVRADQLPWHYNFVWIAISTPLLQLGLFAVGLALFAWRSLRRPLSDYPSNRLRLYVAGWWLAPVVAPVVLGSPLFDAWRHHLFVYPPMVFVALIGADEIQGALKRWPNPRTARIARRVASALCALLLLSTAWTMVRSHPLQNVYFNSLVGGAEGARGQYELDYWGLSYRIGLEALLAHTEEEEIRLAVDRIPGRNSAHILPPDQRSRLRYVARDEADYFVGVYRAEHMEYGFGTEIHAHAVDGAKILSVRKLAPLPSTSP